MLLGDRERTEAALLNIEIIDYWNSIRKASMTVSPIGLFYIEQTASDKNGRQQEEANQAFPSFIDFLNIKFTKNKRDWKTIKGGRKL